MLQNIATCQKCAATFVDLDCSKTKTRLTFKTCWNFLLHTAYMQHACSMYAACMQQVCSMQHATCSNLAWLIKLITLRNILKDHPTYFEIDSALQIYIDQLLQIQKLHYRYPTILLQSTRIDWCKEFLKFFYSHLINFQALIQKITEFCILRQYSSICSKFAACMQYH